MASKILSVFLALTLASPVLSTTVAEKVAQLRLAPTAVDRVKLLQDDSDWVFDFLNPPGAAGETIGGGGHTVSANAGTFPAVIGNGMAMAIGYLGPCGYNTPHTHPRATEFNFAVNGTLQAGLLTENGARFIFNEVKPGSAAIFPKGAIHFEMNTECEPAVFVAAFNDEDPGVDQIAQRFFGLAPAFVAAALGGDVGIQQVKGLESKIPDNVALGTEECLKRCGIYNKNQPTAQRQPRVPANSFEDSAAAGAHDLSGGISLNNSDGKPNPLIIGLISAAGLMGLGYVALLVGCCVRRRKEKDGRTRGAKYFKTGSEFAPQGAVYEGGSYDPPKH